MPQLQSINSVVLSFLYGPSLTSIHDHWKNHSIDCINLCRQKMFLLFNTLSRFAMAFLPRSKHFLISWLQSSSTMILELKKRKSVTISTFSLSICHEVMGPNAMIFVFWMLSFKPFFPLSSFTLIKRLFSSSSFSALRVESSAYLRLLIFLPAILILACASSSPVFLYHDEISTKPHAQKWVILSLVQKENIRMPERFIDLISYLQSKLMNWG